MNPYKSLPGQNFWKTGVAGTREDIVPTVASTFRIGAEDRVATAGSCFAQNLSKHMLANGHVTFHAAEALREGDPVFSARTGNIYTAHQLLQLFDEAIGGEVDETAAIRREDGRFVDMHRPYMAPEGFETAAEVIEARRAHQPAVKQMFAGADVFVFTLGLTEAWVSAASGRVLPVAPQIYARDGADAAFHNFDLAEVDAAMEDFLTRLLSLNPGVRVLLTVSPVPLTATYTPDHVLVATMHSKSVLRVVCSQLTARHESVYYFPSYEMIANPFTAGSAYDDDNLRTVKPAEVARVMQVFDETYVGTGAAAADTGLPDDDLVCDEVEIEKSVGF